MDEPKKPQKKPDPPPTPEQAEVLRKIDVYVAERLLDVVDKQILGLVSQYPSINLTELGKACGMTPSTVSRRMKKPAFREAYDRLTGSTMELLEQNARRAHRRLGALIQHEDKKIALEACKLTLQTYHAQRSLVIETKPTVIYKTTVEADGSLIQNVLEAELVKP